MTANEILEHFLARSPWLDRETTVDRIILGDGDKPIRRVLVSWMSTLPTVRRAIEGGFDLLMTHEPTFWLHSHEVETLDRLGGEFPKHAEAGAKRGLIEGSGLVVMRNHDAWDRMPEVGIPWALAQSLGLTGRPCAIGNGGYQLAYDIEATEIGVLAGRFAAVAGALGDPAVQLFGNADAVVTRLGIGTGCCCRPEIFRAMGCDGAVVCDDGCWYWQDVAWALEAGLPLVRMGHGTTEEPGMATLTQYINDNLPGVTAEHYPLSLGVTYHGEALR